MIFRRNKPRPKWATPLRESQAAARLALTEAVGTLPAPEALDLTIALIADRMAPDDLTALLARHESAAALNARETNRLDNAATLARRSMVME